VRRADNLTTFMTRLFWNLGASTSWNPQGLSRPVMVLLYIYAKHVDIHLAVCLTTGPKPLPKLALQIVRSRASSFKWKYPLLSLRSSDSSLRLLPRLPVTSIPPCFFPSITRCRRQFLFKMWPMQFAFRLLIYLMFLVPSIFTVKFNEVTNWCNFFIVFISI
jgi:hypothetical protein